MIRNAKKCKYKIQAYYASSNAVSMLSPMTVQPYIFTTYGRPNEQKKSIMLRLDKQHDVVTIGEIKFKESR